MMEPAESSPMIAIRIPKEHWGNAWSALIEVAPIRLVAKDPICEVIPAHLEVLQARRIPFEIVQNIVRVRGQSEEKRRRAQAD
jgi:hypothetical protein